MLTPKDKLKKITRFVLVAHLSLFLFMMLPAKRSKKRVFHAKKVLRENVRVIHKEKPKVLVAQSKKKIETQPAPKKNVKSPSRPTAQQPTKAQAQSAVKVEKKASLKPPPMPQLQKFPEAPEKEVASDIILPKAIEKLSLEEETLNLSEENDESIPYGENLSVLIFENIQIKPDAYVAVELTLNKRGEIINLKHCHSSDALSRDKVLKEIKEIKFPHFFGEIAKEPDYTFVLTLKGKGQ